MVASHLVTMADSGQESIAGYAVGNLPFDDEGIETENTIIIKDGKLASYLHNRETAAEFGVAPGRALFVGDSSIDVATARNAGVAVWALPYGYNMGQPIAACAPDRIIADCAALLN
jgi:predicted Zn-dependent protease